METCSSQSNFTVFADASEKAYGAVVFIGVEYEARVECRIASSKTRVEPLAKQTLSLSCCPTSLSPGC